MNLQVQGFLTERINEGVISKYVMEREQVNEKIWSSNSESLQTSLHMESADVHGQNTILQCPCPYPSLSVTPQSEYTVLTRSELLPDAMAAL